MKRTLYVLVLAVLYWYLSMSVLLFYSPGVTYQPAQELLPTPGSLEWRLDRLVEQLEQQRQTLHIPGMAIAIVKDDEVVPAHRCGVTNTETETPVPPEIILPSVHLPKPSPPLSLACLLTKGRWTGTML